MDKLLEKYNHMTGEMYIVSGLLAAQAITSRKLMEAKTKGERDILLSVLEDLVTLINKAKLNED